MEAKRRLVGVELAEEDLPELLRPAELAVFAGVSMATVYRHIQAGLLRTVRNRRPALIHRDEAIRYARRVRDLFGLGA